MSVEIKKKIQELAKGVHVEGFSMDLNIGNGDDVDWGSEDAYIIASQTCCGAAELGYVNADDPKHVAALLNAMPKSRLVVYYGIEESIKTMLLDLGFKQVSEFFNGNTGNLVYILHFYKDWT